MNDNDDIDYLVALELSAMLEQSATIDMREDNDNSDNADDDVALELQMRMFREAEEYEFALDFDWGIGGDESLDQAQNVGGAYANIYLALHTINDRGSHIQVTKPSGW